LGSLYPGFRLSLGLPFGDPKILEGLIRRQIIATINALLLAAAIPRMMATSAS
jgi:hypothetical protein